jgi:DNA-binding response OmpR family regulator
MVEGTGMAEPAGRVLLVDDTPQILGLLADNLGVEGFEVRTAANGTRPWPCWSAGAPT